MARERSYKPVIGTLNPEGSLTYTHQRHPELEELSKNLRDRFEETLVRKFENELHVPSEKQKPVSIPLLKLTVEKSSNLAKTTRDFAHDVLEVFNSGFDFTD